jgi:hypothetical protein
MNMRTTTQRVTIALLTAAFVGMAVCGEGSDASALDAKPSFAAGTTME